MLKYTTRLVAIDNIDFIFTHILANGTTCTVYYDKANDDYYLLSVISKFTADKVKHLPREGFILMSTVTDRHYIGYRLPEFIIDNSESLYQTIDECSTIINEYKISLNLFVIETGIYENHC